MLRLSLASELESSALQLRRNVIFLLAGDPDLQRDTWRLLLEMTDSFRVSDNAVCNQGDDDSHDSSEWLRFPAQRASITWSRFTGDVLLALLALAGDDPAMWKTATSNKIDVMQQCSGIPLLDHNVSHVLSFAEARLSRMLSPAEQRRCRDLFFRFTLLHGKLNFIHANGNNIFSSLMPLILSFPQQDENQHRQQQHDDNNNKGTQPLRRSIIAATASTLAMMADVDGRGTSGVLLWLKAAVEEKRDEPVSAALESGFRIAELLAVPPVQHGLFIPSAAASSSEDSFEWWSCNDRRSGPATAAASKIVVSYFSSLLRQVGDVILLLLAPSSSSHVASLAASSSTNARVLCASVLFVGRLLLPANQQPKQKQEREQEQESENGACLHSQLSLLDLPRLALVERELLTPCFSALLSPFPTEGDPACVTNALRKLESLLFALHSLPDMIVSPAVQRAVSLVVALVWDKIGGGNGSSSSSSIVAMALSMNNTAAAVFAGENDVQRKVARSCLRLVVGTVMEAIMFRSSQSSSSLTSMMLRPIILAATQLHTASPHANVIESIVVLAKEAAENLLLAASGGGWGSVTNRSPTIKLPNRDSATDQQALLVYLFLAELFKESVAVQSTRGGGGSNNSSDANRARMRFVCALVAQIDVRRLLLAQAASAGGVLSFYESLLRLCLWTFTLVAAADEDQQQEHEQEQAYTAAGSFIATLQLLESLPPIDDVLLPSSKTAAVPVVPLLNSIQSVSDQLLDRISKSRRAHNPFVLSVQRNLNVIQRSCEIMLMSLSSRSPSSSASLLSSASGGAAAAEASYFRPLFTQLHNLFARRLWSALCATLMDITNKLGSLNLRRLDGDAKAHLAALLAPEVVFVATKVLFMATLKQEQLHQQKQQKAAASTAAVRSRMAAFRNKPPPLATAPAAAPTAVTQHDDGEGNGDDLAISASCCFLSLVALMRLDDDGSGSGGRNDGTRKVIFTALHNALTNRGKAEAAAFAAAVLDVLVRVTDDDEEGHTIRNIVFFTSCSSSTTCETLLLEIARSDASSPPANGPPPPPTSCVEFQALRLCTLNALGACYQRVPRQAKFCVVESLVVGLFRASAARIQQPSTTTSGADEGGEDDRQLLRLGAAAFLNSVAPAIALVSASDLGGNCRNVHESSSSETTKDDAELLLQITKLLALCEHVSQFRSGARGEQMLFDAEINAHGKAAIAAIKKIVPAEVMLMILRQDTS